MRPAGLQVLLIKTSSMGDLVHTLSAVEEARAQVPDITIDWISEEAFADLPVLSPAVRRVIPVALRRWKKNWWSAQHRRERETFKTALRETHYDIVIDAQGLIKSAWIVRLARTVAGGRWGYDWSSAREPLASLVLDHKVAAAKGLPAIERLRILFGQALGYTLKGGPFTLSSAAASQARDISAANMIASPFVLFLHGTSRLEKGWPADHWIALGRSMIAAGFHVALPWGSPQEHQAAQRIAAVMALPAKDTDDNSASMNSHADPSMVHSAAKNQPSLATKVTVLPRLTIAELIPLLRQASGAIGVDSGLMHLSAALAKPTVAIMSAAHDPRFAAARFAPYWAAHARVLATTADQRQILPQEVYAAWTDLMGTSA